MLPLSTCAGQWGRVPWSEGTSVNNWATNTMMCAGSEPWEHNVPTAGLPASKGEIGCMGQ